MSELERMVDETRRWVETVVIGLGLCPFASGPWEAGLVRIVVSRAANSEALAEDLAQELAALDRESKASLETTLLVHPWVLGNFDEYNSFLDIADLLLDRLGLVGVVQIASFHPDYRFAGAVADDVANATNRSPHPMLHLLRESSVEDATRSHPDPSGIPRRNEARLRALGWRGLAAVRAGLTPPGRPPASARGRSSG